MSVTDVCLAVGFSSLGSFSARFTELTGESPTAYRARDHGEFASLPGCVTRDITRPIRRRAGSSSSRDGEAGSKLVG
jgi:AraC-like DNA-binding protein